jgi:hypothetical protein
LTSKDQTSESAVLEIKIYRFWSFDLANNVPNETPYFLKVINIINASNPVFYKNKFAKINQNERRTAYPVDNKDSNKIANYIIHSE